MKTSLHQTQTIAWQQGWRLLASISLGLLLLACAVMLLQPDVEGVRRVIRVTARTSFAFFLLAFTASSIARRWPNKWTRWQMSNRRYLGLSFAVSHTIHLVAILAFAQLDPLGFHAASNFGSIISGGLAYVFIAAMAATSFDAAQRWLGSRLWSRLHWLGSYYIWLSFMVTFGKRIPMSPTYALPIVILLLALSIRLWPKIRRAPH